DPGGNLRAAYSGCLALCVQHLVRAHRAFRGPDLSASRDGRGGRLRPGRLLPLLLSRIGAAPSGYGESPSWRLLFAWHADRSGPRHSLVAVGRAPPLAGDIVRRYGGGLSRFGAGNISERERPVALDVVVDAGPCFVGPQTVSPLLPAGVPGVG